MIPFSLDRSSQDTPCILPYTWVLELCGTYSNLVSNVSFFRVCNVIFHRIKSSTSGLGNVVTQMN